MLDSSRTRKGYATFGQIRGVLAALLLGMALAMSATNWFAQTAEAAEYALGSSVYFGSYFQDQITDEATIEILDKEADFQNDEAELSGVKVRKKGRDYFRKTPIEWRVLEVNGGVLSLISEKVLDYRRFSNFETFWDTSELREWLNGDFYNKAFGASERASILVTTNSFHQQTYDDWRTRQDGTTAISSDKVYLLDKSDVEAGLLSNAGVSTIAYATPYVNTDESAHMWWLRGPSGWSYGNQQNTYIDRDGNFSAWYQTWDRGVRPVIRVSANAEGLSSTAPAQKPIKSERKTLSKRFVLGKDNNSFFHGAWTDPNSGFYQIMNYNIDLEYFNLLTKEFDLGAKACLGIASLIPRNADLGRCFGIASTMGLVHEGYLPLSGITSHSASSYYDMKPPYQNALLTSTIHYYHIASTSLMLQAGTSFSIPNSVRNGIKYVTQETPGFNDFLHSMVNAASLDHDLVFAYPGHAVLITDCYYNDSDGTHTLVVYDENSVYPGEAEPKGSFGKITVNLQEGTLRYVDYSGNVVIDSEREGADEQLCFADVKDLASAASEGIKVAKKRSVLTVSSRKEIRITNKSGKVIFESDGFNISSELPVYKTQPLFASDAVSFKIDDEMLCLEIDSPDGLVIESTGDDKLTVALYDADNAAELVGMFEKATMSFDEGIAIEGSAHYLTAGISSAEANAEGGKDVYVLSGDQAADLKLEPVPESTDFKVSYAACASDFAAFGISGTQSASNEDLPASASEPFVTTATGLAPEGKGNESGNAGDGADDDTAGADASEGAGDGVNSDDLININSFDIRLEYPWTTYNFGRYLRPKVTVGNLVENRDYLVVYLFNKDPGTAEVSVLGSHAFDKSSKYNGYAELTFEIRPIDLRSASTKLEKRKLAYTGKTAKPTVTFSGHHLEQGKDYRISCTSKKIGKSIAKVQGIGNFYGTVELPFTIVPAKAKVKSAKPGNKSVTVSAKKQKGGVKYEFSWRQGKGKWKTKATAKTSFKITKLKSKKSCQVRVRAIKKVGKTTYRGSWSKAKTVTPK